MGTAFWIVVAGGSSTSRVLTLNNKYAYFIFYVEKSYILVDTALY